MMRFRRLRDILPLKQKRGKKLYAPNPEELREAVTLKPGFYAEVNLNANMIRNYIGRLLEHFGIQRIRLSFTSGKNTGELLEYF